MSFTEISDITAKQRLILSQKLFLSYSHQQGVSCYRNSIHCEKLYLPAISYISIWCRDVDLLHFQTEQE